MLPVYPSTNIADEIPQGTCPAYYLLHAQTTPTPSRRAPSSPTTKHPSSSGRSPSTFAKKKTKLTTSPRDLRSATAPKAQYNEGHSDDITEVSLPSPAFPPSPKLTLINTANLPPHHPHPPPLRLNRRPAQPNQHLCLGRRRSSTGNVQPRIDPPRRVPQRHGGVCGVARREVCAVRPRRGR